MNDKDETKMSNKVSDFITLLENSTDEYYSNFNTEHELFNSRLDMMHTLELDDLTYHQVAHLGLDIRDICRTRRKYKNAYLIREPIMKFVKDNPKFIEELKKLKEELVKVESYMGNMHYNTRQKVEGVEKLSKGDSLENVNREDIINLNRIIDNFGIKYESHIEKYSMKNDPICEVLIKVWFDDCLPRSIKQLRHKTNALKNDIDRFFGKQYKHKSSTITISDMLSDDDFMNSKLDSKIMINSNGADIYNLRIRAYGTMKADQQNSNKKKRSKSKKRR